MAEPLTGGMIPDMVLPPGYVIRLNALDPTTGNAVSGVTVTDVSFYVRGMQTAAPDQAPMPLLVPSTD